MSCSVARPLDSVTVSSSSATVSGIGPIPEAAPASLCTREPHVPADRLVAEMVPPPRFDSVRFDTYIPDPNQPSQTEAVRVLSGFAAGLGGAHATGAGRRGFLGFGRAKAPKAPAGPRGVYLDGGYGVGKTHLLASLWHATPAEPSLKAFGTFVELTNLVGALGFQKTVQTLSGHRLLCIDEFELDDPGDTVLVSTLLGKLVDAGVALAATSNTLPGKLGEGRFASVDFLREIQGLSAHFRSLRIDGEDYRHRGLPEAPAPYSDEEVTKAAYATEGASLDDFPHLLGHLARVHPSRYGAMTDGLKAVCLTDVAPVPDQSTALRLVVLADRLYDREVPVLASGLPFDRLFSEEMLNGGYRKKYFRAISRLTALARDAKRLVEH
ncbi:MULTISPECIES: cell division protein ZapE [Streptomyces]|uniref:Cell division protein ZapE n=1 Tax=Streptomyces caniscabiei TaxID=2746961 RepID=A0ABU4MPB6_9ACTN|nr:MULTISPECIES: cell division protein ZapE [Streptomyces]MDX2941709.1 cell division protein ZapE [Streptomyces caniscabiei]MDX2951912.1 cell division protein ZapE [Streptomyces caniscabiei]MDX2985929.1 cell division protein ZapE [Streptomyces caniscabiei]MDX3012070.1 cell division protein ZapE [Streptomyces caniscabiei]MDX3038627.1 cell division protein ZapE [Streptomyces caniscabiei]